MDDPNEKKIDYSQYYIQRVQKPSGEWVALLIPKIKPVPKDFNPHYVQA